MISFLFSALPLFLFHSFTLCSLYVCIYTCLFCSVRVSFSFSLSLFLSVSFVFLFFSCSLFLFVFFLFFALAKVRRQPPYLHVPFRKRCPFRGADPPNSQRAALCRNFFSPATRPRLLSRMHSFFLRLTFGASFLQEPAFRIGRLIYPQELSVSYRQELSFCTRYVTFCKLSAQLSFRTRGLKTSEAIYLRKLPFNSFPC